MVIGGLIAHPFDAAGDMLRFYRDAVAGCSDDLTVFAGARPRARRVGHEARGDGRLPHRRPRARRRRDLAPFKSWGSPLMVEVGPMPYPVMNTLLDAAYPAGALNYWLSSFTRGPARRADRRDRRALRVGALADDGDPARALPRRGDARRRRPTRPCRTAAEGWNLLLPSEWMDPAEPRRTSRGRRETYAALGQHFGGGRWLNYLGDDQGDDAIRAAYGPNYDRLVEVKRRYDPDNVFHLNHNIVP